MGLKRWFGKRSGGEPPAHGTRQELAAAEERVLEALQRECDRIHADLVEAYALLPAERRPDLPEAPPRFADREQAQAYMEHMRALLKRR